MTYTFFRLQMNYMYRKIVARFHKGGQLLYLIVKRNYTGILISPASRDCMLKNVR